MKILDYDIESGYRVYDARRPYRELVSEPLPSGKRLTVELADRGMQVKLEGEAWLFCSRGTLERLLFEVARQPHQAKAPLKPEEER